MQLNIIIVNYNSGHHLKTCLEAILKSNGSLNNRTVTVYDNGSTDGSLAGAQDAFPRVNYIRSLKNLGFAKAVNEAVKSTRGEYVLLVNPDVVLFPMTIESMLRFMELSPRCAILGGELLSPLGYRQPPCRRFPNYFNVLFGRRSLVRRIFPDNPFSKKYLYLDLDYTKPQKVDFVEGSLMMVRRKALEEIGLFDEGFFLYLEDADVAYRMQKSGWETWCLPRSYALHFRGENYRKDNIHPAIYHSKGFYRFFTKHYQPAWLVRLLLRALLTLRLVYVISTGSVKKAVP